MTQKKPYENLLRSIPTKWAIALIAVLIGYALLQPVLNAKLGWSLPSLAWLAGEEEPKNTPKKSPSEDPPSADPPSEDPGVLPKEAVEPKSKKTSDSSETKAEPSNRTDKNVSVKTARSTKNSPEKKVAEEKVAEKKATEKDSPDKKYGLLVDIGRDRYQSPAGLIYGPGSEEGHRLKHVQRHLEDQENRPGKHGVFDGDMAAVLRWIDDAYQRAGRGAKGVSKREEEGRTVIEATFEKPIGYIGGRDGKRAGNPAAKRLRLVVDERQVITAFPF